LCPQTLIAPIVQICLKALTTVVTLITLIT
jgi:hypothetical protein